MAQTYDCICIDDDPLFLRKMEVYIHEVPWLRMMSTFTNPIQGATAVISNKPDIVFLDIEMPHVDGTYLADWIEPKLAALDKRPKLVVLSSLSVAEEDRLASVSGYLNKSEVDSPEELARQLEIIMS